MPKKSDDKESESIEPLESEEKESSSKGDKRQFQIGPGQHEHLTKAEAKKKGFHWKD